MPEAFITLAANTNTYFEWKKAFYQAKYNLEYGVEAEPNIYEESLRLAQIEGGKYDY